MYLVSLFVFYSLAFSHTATPAQHCVADAAHVTSCAICRVRRRGVSCSAPDASPQLPLRWTSWFILTILRAQRTISLNRCLTLHSAVSSRLPRQTDQSLTLSCRFSPNPGSLSQFGRKKKTVHLFTLSDTLR